ncbi:unnamed protein product, partial [Allacma fusca]
MVLASRDVVSSSQSATAPAKHCRGVNNIQENIESLNTSPGKNLTGNPCEKRSTNIELSVRKTNFPEDVEYFENPFHGKVNEFKNH